jgi:hypothetical protein
MEPGLWVLGQTAASAVAEYRKCESIPFYTSTISGEKASAPYFYVDNLGKARTRSRTPLKYVNNHRLKPVASGYG